MFDQIKWNRWSSLSVQMEFCWHLAGKLLSTVVSSLISEGWVDYSTFWISFDWIAYFSTLHWMYLLQVFTKYGVRILGTPIQSIIGDLSSSYIEVEEKSNWQMLLLIISYAKYGTGQNQVGFGWYSRMPWNTIRNIEKTV